jgi:hypothetical protein
MTVTSDIVTESHLVFMEKKSFFILRFHPHFHLSCDVLFLDMRPPVLSVPDFCLLLVFMFCSFVRMQAESSPLHA